MDKAIRHLPANFDQIGAKLAGIKVPNTKKIVSLFSGCGGMDLGFVGGFQYGGRTYDRLPFDIAWANDLSEAACKTYNHNLKHNIYCGDLWNQMGTLPKRADIVIGGFPCQDVSINGAMAAENGERTTLYKAMQEVIKRTRPLVFIAENVKGIMMAHSRVLYEEMTAGFEALGYDATAKIYLAADYGVPQMRERVLIIGTRKGMSKPFTHPAPPFSKEKWITSRQALSDLESKEECDDTSHIWSRAKASPDQGRRRLTAEKPSTTIRAECHGNIQFHYKLDRRLSMREAARLQSFPDNFEFCSGIRQTERQIGNAVPPVLAWHVACAVQEYLG